MSGSDHRKPPGRGRSATGGDARRGGQWRHAETQDSLVSVDRFVGRPTPALTLLCHPDVRRVGDVARLPGLSFGQGVKLSRLEPAFAAPGATQGEALIDPRISRRPVWLESASDGGVRVDTSETSTRVHIGDRLVEESANIPLKDIERGVVLQLGGRFAMLLHMLGPPQSPAPRFGMVGANPQIEKLRGDVTRVADVDVPVLIRGESGTGKELLAHAIHDASPRSSRPFVAVNMAAITPSTAASELFGHVRGAFTGASRDHDGLFVRAHGGTLFLDEIGETPAELQAMLLRVLETGEIQPVGATRTRRVDVRLVAATDADLETATRDGSFRLPLLHRLSGYELRLPPLRDRRDDVARLFVHFLEQELASIGERQRIDPSGPGGFVPGALMARLCRYDWPGNVRQLRNLVRQLVISSRGAEVMVVDAAVERMLSEQPKAPAPIRETVPEIPIGRREKKKPSELSEDELIEVLRKHDYRLGPVATELGMSRTTLYALIEKSPRVRKARDLTADEITSALGQSGADVGAAARLLEVSKRGLQLRITELGLS